MRRRPRSPGVQPTNPRYPAGGEPDRPGRPAAHVGHREYNTGFVLYPDALPFTAGLDLTFSIYDYDSVRTSAGTGADGVSFFLADGSQALS